MAAFNFLTPPPASVLFDEMSMDGLIDVYEQGEAGLAHLSESKRELLLGLVSFIVESGCDLSDQEGVLSKPALLTVVPAIGCTDLLVKSKKSANEGGY